MLLVLKVTVMLLKILIGWMCIHSLLLSCCSQENDLINFRNHVAVEPVLAKRTNHTFLGYFLFPFTSYDITTKIVKTTVGTICYIPISTDLSQCRNRRGIEEEPNLIDVSENATVDISSTSIQRYMCFI